MAMTIEDLLGLLLCFPLASCFRSCYISSHIQSRQNDFGAFAQSLGFLNDVSPNWRACAIYNNWWPMLSALMYVLVPMPCLFFGGGSTQFLTSRDGGGWIDAAKFLTGASAVGSMAIPIILRHAQMIQTGAMLIEFTSFFIFVCTVMCFHRASLEDEW